MHTNFLEGKEKPFFVIVPGIFDHEILRIDERSLEDTVLRIKCDVQLEKEFNVCDQVLKLGRRVLENEKTLRENNVALGDVMYVEMPDSPITIYIVNTRNGTVFDMKVRPSEATLSVKTRVNNLVESRDTFILRKGFGKDGEMLANSRKISEYGIVDGDVLFYYRLSKPRTPEQEEEHQKKLKLAEEARDKPPQSPLFRPPGQGSGAGHDF